MLFFRIVAIQFVVVILTITSVKTMILHKLFAQISNVLFCNNIFLESSISRPLFLLRQMVFGQPFVINYLIPKVESHFSRENKKILVLHLHGPTGVGKTLVSDHMLSMDFFKNKHIFSPTTRNENMNSIKKYKEHISAVIDNKIRNCGRSVFVFDDITELGSSYFEDLPPFKREPGIDYSQSLFIYISQSDTENIISATSRLMKQGKSRKNINLEEFLRTMETISKENDGYVKYLCDLFTSFYTDGSETKRPTHDHIKEIYIPFLPLEPMHVKICVDMHTNKLKSSLSNEIMKKVVMNSGCSEQNIFCSKGCKPVLSNLLRTTMNDEL